MVVGQRFVMLVSGDRTPSIDQSISIACLSGMYKGGGEFSWSDEGLVPVDDIVNGIYVD